MKSLSTAMCLLTICACAITTRAQQTPGLPGDAASIAEQDARFARWRVNAPEGTGPYAAERITDINLKTHTLYAPKDLSRVHRLLPIVSFGNGGCRNTSIEFTAFLAEIASHGFFIVAAGRNDVDFGLGAGKTSANGEPLQKVDAQELVRGVNWAVSENARVGSRFYGKLDTKAIAYMGQSCGGIQALTASADPRTRTTVVLNSAYLEHLPAGIPPMTLPEQLPYSSLHAPIAFFIGGKTDVAYGSATKAFAEMTKPPAFIANLGVGHVGAYPAPDMRWTNAVIAWLQWELRGDSVASKMFLGPDCGLCKDPDWSEVHSKGL